MNAEKDFGWGQGRQGVNSLQLPRYRLRTVFAVGALIMAGCSASEPPGADSLEVKLDFSELQKDGKTCEGNDPRPCFQPIRDQPYLEAKPLNATEVRANGSTYALWPYEASQQSAGDSLTVVCQVYGDLVHNADGDESNIWDVVQVPVEYIHPSALSDAENGLSDFGVLRDKNGDITHGFFYVPNMWRNEPGEYIQLDACAPTQNPGNHPTL